MESPIACLAYSPDNRYIACGHVDGAISLHCVNNASEKKSRELLHNFRGHSHGVCDLVWSGDGRYVFSGSDDGTICVWSVERRARVRRLEGHSAPVFCLAVNPQGTVLGSGSLDTAVGLWDVRGGKNMEMLYGHLSGVLSIAFSGDGRLVASCGSDGFLCVWLAESFMCVGKTVHPAGIVSTVFTPNSRHVAGCDVDGKVFFVCAETGGTIRTVETGQKEVLRMCFVFRGEECFLFTGSRAGDVCLWDVGTKKRVKHRELGRCCGISVSPSGRVASGEGVAFETVGFIWE
ncbi:MAG: WD40 repeat-containing protein [Amphiamblys sp. WSBS2006]|nr:MAG: WD40 repeat-containing protein [Amphiamblys sp. WSBS2006]